MTAHKTSGKRENGPKRPDRRGAEFADRRNDRERDAPDAMSLRDRDPTADNGLASGARS